MRLHLKYHFMARAPLHGVTAYRKIVAERQVEVAMRSDAQAPMAFVFKEQMQKMAHFYRFDQASGALFKRHMKAHAIDARNGDKHFSPDYPTYITERMRHDRFAEIFGEEVAYYSVPEYELTSLRDVNAADIAAADRVFDDCVSEFIGTDDGWVWRKVEEPVFHLYRTNHGWKTVLYSSPDPRIGSDRRHFHFGLGQYEEMLDWKEKLAELTGRAATEDEFTSMDVYEATRDGYAIDVEFALLDLIEHFDRTSRSIAPGNERILSLPSMPLPVLEVFVRARRILEIPREDRGDDIHAAAVELLESIPEIIEAHHDYKVLFAKPSENAYQIEKWHARPISLLVPALDRRFSP
jgi:hypothetical protein